MGHTCTHAYHSLFLSFPSKLTMLCPPMSHLPKISLFRVLYPRLCFFVYLCAWHVLVLGWVRALVCLCTRAVGLFVDGGAMCVYVCLFAYMLVLEWVCTFICVRIYACIVGCLFWSTKGLLFFSIRLILACLLLVLLLGFFPVCGLDSCGVELACVGSRVSLPSCAKWPGCQLGFYFSIASCITTSGVWEGLWQNTVGFSRGDCLQAWLLDFLGLRRGSCV